MDIERFDAISPNKRQVFSQKKISQHIPELKETDYQRGYIVRYFIQKSNDMEAPIYEIDYIGHRKFFDDPFNTSVSLDWKITGTDEHIKEANFKSIKLHYIKMPKLNIYLPNLLQFKQKKDLEL
jgi:hypothetical protein